MYLLAMEGPRCVAGGGPLERGVRPRLATGEAPALEPQWKLAPDSYESSNRLESVAACQLSAFDLRKELLQGFKQLGNQRFVLGECHIPAVHILPHCYCWLVSDGHGQPSAQSSPVE